MGVMGKVPDLETQLLDRLVVEQSMEKLLQQYRREAGSPAVQHAEARLDGDQLQIRLDGEPVALTRSAAVELVWADCVQMDILRARERGR